MPPREGAFAALLAMPERNLVVMPDHITTDQAALAEPIACGWHAVRLGRNALGAGTHRALVLGGGAIGLGYVPCKGESPDDLLASTYEIEVAGRLMKAEASLKPMYDPASKRVKEG